MTPSLDSLLAKGEIQSLDVHFARTMGRLAHETRPSVLMAAALVSRQVRSGHVCLPATALAELLGSPEAVSDSDPPVAGGSGSSDAAHTQGRTVLQAAEILAQLKSSALVSDGSAATPLVLDGAGRLYLRRYWQHEQAVALGILNRAEKADLDIDPGLLEEGLNRLFGPARPEGEPDLQRLAAATAVRRRFCVISGGPGTGKTFTVAKILVLLLEQAAARQERTPRILLMAPTGKAAARLQESLAGAAGKLRCDQKTRAGLALQASTIHRALGAAGPGSVRFRRCAASPLLADLILVDEASMVHVSLMARLMDALLPQARLILMGDRDQLASVEAGAVLGDICNREGDPGDAGGQEVQVPAASKAPCGRRRFPPERNGPGCAMVHLTRSYRYRPDSGIAALAAAINGGRAGEALEILASPGYQDVALAPPQDPGPLQQDLRNEILEGYEPYLEADTLQEKFRAFGRFRVLCGHRRGPSGVRRINGMVEDLFRSLGKIRGETDCYTGRPILVTANDRELGLWNGDVGLVEAGGEGEDPRVFFGDGEGGGRTCSLSRLPSHETVFAMTVHKSQGSEFHGVVILLPEAISPVICRELLYTAVTRAREKVVIHAEPGLFRQAVEQRIRRFSGLRDLLWGQ